MRVLYAQEVSGSAVRVFEVVSTKPVQGFLANSFLNH